MTWSVGAPAFWTTTIFRKRFRYLDGPSSMNQGHQLAGLAFVVAFLTTMIFFMMGASLLLVG